MATLSSSSCPNSPRRSRLSGESYTAVAASSSSCVAAATASELYLKGLTEDEVVEVEGGGGGTSLSQSLDSSSNSSGGGGYSPRPTGIHRSASTTNAVRPRTAPAGLYSYTGERWRRSLIIN